MIALAELGGLVKDTVKAAPGERVADRIAAAARALRLPRGRVEDWWYGEVRRVEAHEADAIRRNAGRARESQLLRLEREIDRLRAEIDALGEDQVARAPRRRPPGAVDRASRNRRRERRHAPA